MSSEDRLAMIRCMETSGYTVATREERGLLIVTVSDARGQVATAISTSRFDFEEAYQQWQAWRAQGKRRNISRIVRAADERESA